MDRGGISTGGLEETLQDGNLYRNVNALIVAHLRDNNLNQAASAVASATMTPLNVEAPPKKLMELVAKGLAVEKDEMLRGVSSTALFDSSIPTAYGLIPVPPVSAVDFSAVTDSKGPSKSFPKHETRHVSEHKNVARCARFSPDGRFLATGSADTSIKLFEISKVKQMMLADARDGGPVRSVIRTFYDHLQPINDLDFHPQNPILISGAKDRTIKFFDFSKTVARKAFRIIQDTHNVRSVSFHPSGEYLVAGTDHSFVHLYDVNTFQCYLPANVQEISNGAINKVRYSSTGGMYVTASQDGAIRLWDGVTSQCIRTIPNAHGTAEATSAVFTKDQRYVLSSGKDSIVNLWDIGTGRRVNQYLGAAHSQLRSQAVFNETEEFILSIDEPTNEIIVWDALTAEKVTRWPSNHIGSPRWLEHSPVEAAFVTCGTDRSIRFWKET